MGDLGWSSYIENLEDMNIRACRETAIENGHTIEEADECDDGSVGCPDCPFTCNTNNPEDGNP